MPKITGKIKSIDWVTTWNYKCFNKECLICRFTLNEDNVVINTCGHGFHNHCINTWLEQSNKKTCPVCNKKFQD